MSRNDIHYDCSTCRYQKNSLFKEPCMSCNSDKENNDLAPTNYNPADEHREGYFRYVELQKALNNQDCESCRIDI